jgi:serpin B
MRSFALALSLFPFGVLAACTPSQTTGPVGAPVAGSATSASTAAQSTPPPLLTPTSPASAPVATAPNMFAVVRDALPAKANFVVSTYSLERCLGFLALGAKGKTRTELLAVLHAEDPAAWLAKSATSASAGQGKVVLQESNGVWVDTGFPLLPTYLKSATGNQAAVETLDFSKAPDLARSQINKKVGEQTKGKIAELLPTGSVDPLTRVVLTNAVYFLGNWRVPFAPASTRDESFTTAEGKSISVPMMNAKQTLPGGKYSLAENETGLAASIAYAGSSYELLVVLPDGPLADFEQRLQRDTAARIAKALPNEGEVALALPRFEVRSGGLVQGALAKLGLETALSDKADYHGVSVQDALVVSKIAHQVFIKVDENGTEAAAATAAVMSLRGLSLATPRSVRFDRPFFYAVYNKESGATLFSGHVGNPLEK